MNTVLVIKDVAVQCQALQAVLRHLAAYVQDDYFKEVLCLSARTLEGYSVGLRPWLRDNRSLEITRQRLLPYDKLVDIYHFRADLLIEALHEASHVHLPAHLQQQLNHYLLEFSDIRAMLARILGDTAQHTSSVPTTSVATPPTPQTPYVQA